MAFKLSKCFRVNLKALAQLESYEIYKIIAIELLYHDDDNECGPCKSYNACIIIIIVFMCMSDH